PNTSKAYRARGKSYSMKDDDKLAMMDFNKAILLDLNCDLNFFERGLAFEYDGLLENALQDYTESIRLNPYNKKAFGHRGLVLMKQGELNKAILDFSIVIHLDSKDY